MYKNKYSVYHHYKKYILGGQYMKNDLFEKDVYYNKVGEPIERVKTHNVELLEKLRNGKIRLAGNILHSSLVNGEGCRMVIFTQGCLHHCPGCFNPETHDVDGGKEFDIQYLVEEFEKDCPFIDGITLSGGDPILQYDKLIEFCKYVKSRNKTIWCYTGYTFEQLISMSLEKGKESLQDFLYIIDVLVDGQFKQELKEEGLQFRGSSNQRIINTKLSLDSCQVVLHYKTDIEYKNE